MQDIYAEPIKKSSSSAVQGDKGQGRHAAASLTAQRVERYHRAAIEAGLDVLVVQGTVVSAEHVSRSVEPLNLMEFVPSVNVPVVVGGCASYSTALHLMRTGAVGVLVGVGPGRICTTRGMIGVGCRRLRPWPTPRRPYAPLPGDRRVRERHRRRRDAHRRWGRQGHNLWGRRGDAGQRLRQGGGGALPAATRGGWLPSIRPSLAAPASAPGLHGSLEEILVGPARGGRRDAQPHGRPEPSMATTGYQNIKEFQKAEVMYAPSLATEGKAEQRTQGVGMGR